MTKERLGKAEPLKGSFVGVTVRGRSEPRKNCKHCFGRGYVGRDTETGAFVYCNCAMRKPKTREYADSNSYKAVFPKGEWFGLGVYDGDGKWDTKANGGNPDPTETSHTKVPTTNIPKKKKNQMLSEVAFVKKEDALDQSTGIVSSDGVED